MIMNQHRNSSNQLTVDFSEIDSNSYADICKEITKEFNLKPANELIQGLDEADNEIRTDPLALALFR